MSKSTPEYAILNDRKEIVVVDSPEEWAEFFEQFQNRVVKQDRCNNFWVSTVFLGLNHNMFSGKPLWFETMVFDEQNKTQFKLLSRPEEKQWNIGEERGQWRYETWVEALEGHAKALEMVQMGLVERKTSPNERESTTETSVADPDATCEIDPHRPSRPRRSE